MRVGNVFGHVCLSVCLSICLSVCPSVQTITFEPLHIQASFLVCRYIFTISRSSLSIKVIGSNDNFTYFNILILYIWLQVINEVKVTNQGKGHIKVKVKISTSFPILYQILLISTHYSYVVWLQVINKVKFIHQGEGHIKVKVNPFKFYIAHTFCKRVVCTRLNAVLFKTDYTSVNLRLKKRNPTRYFPYIERRKLQWVYKLT